MSDVVATRNLSLLNILSVLVNLNAYQGVMVIFFASITGSFAWAMGALAVANLCSAMLEVPTGMVSDRVGRKFTLVAYHASSALAAGVLFLAESTPLLLVSTLLMGLSMALHSGTGSAFIYENLELLGRKAEFKKYVGQRRALGRVALVVGGLLGVGLIYFYNIRLAIGATFLFQAMAVVVSFLLKDIAVYKPVTTNIYSDVKRALLYLHSDVALRNISVGKIIAVGIGNVEYRFRALFYALLIPEWLVAVVGILNNLVTAIGMKFAHAIVSQFGFFRSLVQSEMVDRVLVSVVVVAQSVVSPFVMVLSGFVFGIRDVAAEDLLQGRYDKDQRATMGSVVGLASTLLYGVFGILVGVIADSIGVMYTMLLIQPIMLVSAWYFYKGIKLAGVN